MKILLEKGEIITENTAHEGCDIMAVNNVSGFYPVISVTDGTVENLGWLEKGGYRVGIRSNNGDIFIMPT